MLSVLCRLFRLSSVDCNLYDVSLLSLDPTEWFGGVMWIVECGMQLPCLQRLISHCLDIGFGSNPRMRTIRTSFHSLHSFPLSLGQPSRPPVHSARRSNSLQILSSPFSSQQAKSTNRSHRCQLFSPLGLPIPPGAEPSCRKR